jgi:hypothetical protein
MSIPTRYLPIDNSLQITIDQSRNDGSLSYSIVLQVDDNKHQQGINLIESLILDETDISTLFEADILDPVR